MASSPANPSPVASAANGSAANGSAANGSAANGSAANGSAANGSAANGSAANGSAANGSAAQRLRGQRLRRQRLPLRQRLRRRRLQRQGFGGQGLCRKRLGCQRFRCQGFRKTVARVCEGFRHTRLYRLDDGKGLRGKVPGGMEHPAERRPGGGVDDAGRFESSGPLKLGYSLRRVLVVVAVNANVHAAHREQQLQSSYFRSGTRLPDSEGGWFCSLKRRRCRRRLGDRAGQGGSNGIFPYS